MVLMDLTKSSMKQDHPASHSRFRKAQEIVYEKFGPSVMLYGLGIHLTRIFNTNYINENEMKFNPRLIGLISTVTLILIDMCLNMTLSTYTYSQMPFGYTYVLIN
ncbi:unnamed protein product, partial [Didymodactylos carnosus]